MNALDALLGHAQPGFEARVMQVAESFRDTFGGRVFAGVPLGDLAELVSLLIEHTPMTDAQTASTIAQLTSLNWWCGVNIEPAVYARLGRRLRRVYQGEIDAAGLKRPRPDPAARRRHVVFVGTLETPLHSPSQGAVGYLRALASDPKNRPIDVYYSGQMRPEMTAYVAEQLQPTERFRFRRVQDHPDYLSEAALRAPCTYHLWCEPRVNIDQSFLAMFGPVVMFTCADEPPLQYADVYWYCHEPDHVARAWRGAPQVFTANYVACRSAPFELAPALRPRSKSDLGLNDEDVLLATVGNRLGVDLDESFVTGVEAALRAHPACRWLMAGPLPEALLGAMRQVLGGRFLHVPFDPDLPGLMSAADVFLNPFRRGGGNAAIIAAAQGATVLTRGDVGDVAAFVPASHRASGPEDYFARLEALIADPALRRAWSAEQQALIEVRLDQADFAKELERMVAAAFDRFRARGGRSSQAVFPAEAEAAAA